MKILVLVLTFAALSFSSIVAEAGIVEGVVSPGALPLEPPPVVDVERALTHVSIEFDDVTAPCVFADTGPLRDEYLGLGVSFSGPGSADGLALLDECGNFGVSGHSSPNFLAANCNSVMLNGGTPWGPETLTFTETIVSCSALVGSNSGQGSTLSMEAYDIGGGLVASDTIVLAPELQLLGVAAAGIKTVVIGSTQPCVWILDDLGFDTELTPVENAAWGTIKALYR
jgi:hypothetical protein